jgi:hypothetical protein
MIDMPANAPSWCQRVSDILWGLTMGALVMYGLVVCKYLSLDNPLSQRLTLLVIFALQTAMVSLWALCQGIAQYRRTQQKLREKSAL